MTGKDLIFYILNNNLMNEEFGIDPNIEDGAFIDADKASLKLGISKTSLLDMARLGIVDSIDDNGVKYFYKNIDLTSIRKERL